MDMRVPRKLAGSKRPGAVAQIRVLNDCGNNRLSLAPFCGAHPLMPEANIHCSSDSCALSNQRQGLAGDCSCRHRVDTSNPLQPVTRQRRLAGVLRKRVLRKRVLNLVG